ncbi:MAG: NAD(P)-dependent alcohol dehydrogenase [Chloroflexi bacterium]|nr:NAD(P)-dependent alcohol dehydrogenase [Chloroflexota bacterium]
MVLDNGARDDNINGTKMRAAVLHGPHDLRVEDVAVPPIGPHEVLVRVRACGICASDVHYFETGAIGRYVVDAPMIVGHEAAGEVAAIGEQVTSLEPGARVAIEPGVTCGRCRFCKSGRYNLCASVVFYATPPVDGAMAEYAIIRADFAHPIPDEASFEQAALVEPLSVGIHAARLTGVQPGTNVIVLGAGPIGLLALVAARHAGAERVIVSDVYPRRLEAARRLGATAAVDVRTDNLAAMVDELTDGDGADALLDTSGNRSVLESAPDLMRRGGAIAVIGLPENDAVTYHMNTVVDKELAIRGVFRYANTFPAGVQLVASGQYPLESVITHSLPLDATRDGFDVVMHQKEEAIKVMIVP